MYHKRKFCRRRRRRHVSLESDLLVEYKMQMQFKLKKNRI